jgi:hypothetical protein
LRAQGILASSQAKESGEQPVLLNLPARQDVEKPAKKDFI